MSESRGLLPCMKSDGRRKDPRVQGHSLVQSPPPLSGTDGLLSGLQISTLAAESAKPCKPSQIDMTPNSSKEQSDRKDAMDISRRQWRYIPRIHDS
ncbi:hypothetical protein ASPTUDRAFT_43127 [Aspergillus tubingensis CBS 134.48]|uniref:Uncharacterized protein n=1 Tax=Aspergillus tubingensis (strain CBS 134.48) TaxID=767770 RepID=A0A1L9N4G1_ASPTC|nr:hypothetical protein ASPTUDRAFT_43127 [Aspergillus tubingensis CBS 134.48]